MKNLLFIIKACLLGSGCMPLNQSDPTSIQGAKKNYLTVNNKLGTIVDTKHQDIILRGTQVPLVYRTTQQASLQPEVVAKIASYGFNFVRVTWSTINDAEHNNDLNVLLKFLENASKHRLLVMIEAHNFTGKNSDLKQAAEYWVRLYPHLKDYQDRVMINIANEWGDNELPMDTYIKSYQEAITMLRDVGYKLPLIIDTGGWGQNINYLAKDDQWKKLMATDAGKMPQPNIMFSIHMYGNWAMDYGGLFSLRKDYLAFQKKAPVMIGEFGWSKPGNPDQSKLNLNDLLQAVQDHNINLCIYSWSGNNPVYHDKKTNKTLDYSYLDLVPATYHYNPQKDQVMRYDFNNDQLTDFGRQIIQNGRLMIAKPQTAAW